MGPGGVKQRVGPVCVKLLVFRGGAAVTRFGALASRDAASAREPSMDRVATSPMPVSARCSPRWPAAHSPIGVPRGTREPEGHPAWSAGVNRPPARSQETFSASPSRTRIPCDRCRQAAPHAGSWRARSVSWGAWRGSRTRGARGHRPRSKGARVKSAGVMVRQPSQVGHRRRERSPGGCRGRRVGARGGACGHRLVKWPHCVPPRLVVNRALPAAVSRYFCKRLLGLSGTVISMSPSARAGLR